MAHPAYLDLDVATWDARVREAYARMDPCRICPRQCQARRMIGETGVCGIGSEAMVSSYGPHFGEEAPLVGRGGSGTIFMTRCNLRCVFCQNADISHKGQGVFVSPEELAFIMLALQRQGCHNINIVTPTHIVPQLLDALVIAVQQGLSLPIVYNCGGYESIETLKLLEGIVDIYMPDFKYADASVGRRFSGVPDYPEVAKAALKEMYRQVGDLVLDTRGIAQRGLLVRHLVLPNDLAGTREVVRFIAEELSPETYVNIMDQYRPSHEAYRYPELSRRITLDEYRLALHMAQEVGLRRLD